MSSPESSNGSSGGHVVSQDSCFAASPAPSGRRVKPEQIGPVKSSSHFLEAWMLSVLAAPSARSLGLAVLRRLHFFIDCWLSTLAPRVSHFPSLEQLNLNQVLCQRCLGPECNARSAPVYVLQERQRSASNGDTVRRLQARRLILFSS